MLKFLHKSRKKIRNSVLESSKIYSVSYLLKLCVMIASNKLASGCIVAGFKNLLLTYIYFRKYETSAHFLKNKQRRSGLLTRAEKNSFYYQMIMTSVATMTGIIWRFWTSANMKNTIIYILTFAFPPTWVHEICATNSPNRCISLLKWKLRFW